MKTSLRVGLVGYGYWGPNLARAFNESGQSEVIECCDTNEKRLRLAKQRYPFINITANFDDVLNNNLVDAIIIATPLSTHFPLAQKALRAGKHVWIEKPMVENSKQAEYLIKLAKKQKKVLFVDHIFLYTEAVSFLKKTITKENLGDVYYFDSSRINLGLFQSDSNVVWDLAIHDIAIMRYLLEEKPISISAFGTSHVRKNLEDTAHLNFNFSKKISAHITVSWLSPVKIRKTIIAGSKKMVIYDDLETSEKVKVYDYGVSVSKTHKMESSTGGYQYRTGNIQVPALVNKEALQTACEHFIDCIKHAKTPLTNGMEALKTIKILEAASRSLLNNGRFERID